MYKRANVYNVVVKRSGRVFARFAVVAVNRSDAHIIVHEWIESGNFDGPLTYSAILAPQGSSHNIFMLAPSDTLPESDPAFPGHSTKV